MFLTIHVHFWSNSMYTKNTYGKQRYELLLDDNGGVSETFGAHPMALTKKNYSKL